MQLTTLPKVSVLIPAFNEEKYILRTLNAIVCQDYPFFEIIVADNASTDQTASIIRKFIESSSLTIPLILVHETSQGTNFARECARKMASGSILAQLDADCIPPSNWLRKGVMALLQGKRVAVTGPYDYFDGDIWMRNFSLISQKVFYPLINLFVQVTGRGAILIGGNAFIRAEILERAGGYNTSLTFYGDDIDLGKRLSSYGRIVFVSSLVQSSSSRRYKANGFWEVNKKYQACFWNLVWHKPELLETLETSHPR
ncbi:MAG: glycosyltransferase family A protein [Bacteroidota bacterium]